mmetsp:Transcript_19718/g.47857  ORF Transcript_19718/g.47857 Transcript_19718/m.47857 type:complete len:815 (+) Transcript_19718:47-2491(+)
MATSAVPRFDKGADVTQEEMSKLGKAMKDPKFRDHIQEYLDEVSDPAHRGEYEQYLEQLEAKGELPKGQELLRADPGLCVKTSIRFKSGQEQKLFINLCQTPQMKDVEFLNSGSGGQNVNLPFTLAPPRPDKDKNGENCLTLDMAVSNDTFTRADQNVQVLKLLIDIACQNLQEHYLKGAEEVKRDFKRLKGTKCKGDRPYPMSVRSEQLKVSKAQDVKKGHGGDILTPSELKQMKKDIRNKNKKDAPAAIEEIDEEEFPQKPVEEEHPTKIRVPQHKLVQVGVIDLAEFMGENSCPVPNRNIPKELKLVVELPGVKKADDIEMEVTGDNICIEVSNRFYLDLPLPYEIDEARGKAKYDKIARTLTITAPVIPKIKPEDMDVDLTKTIQVVGQDYDSGISENEGSEDELDDIADDDEEEREADKENVEEEPAKNGESKGDDEPLEDSPHKPSKQQYEKLVEGLASKPEVQRSADLIDDRVGTGVVASAADPDVGSAAEEGLPDEPEFVAADTFNGPRPGYIFTTRNGRPGYYRDGPTLAARPSSRETSEVDAEGTTEMREVSTKRFEKQKKAKRAKPQPLVQEVDPTCLPEADKPEASSSPSAPSTERENGSGPAEDEQAVPSIPVSLVSLQEQPAFTVRQNRQNVSIHFPVDKLPGDPVPGLTHVRVDEERLVATFCTDVHEEGAEVIVRYRHSLKQVCHTRLDGKQYHWELRSGRDGVEVVLVIRKIEQGYGDTEVFDADAEWVEPLPPTAPPEPESELEDEAAEEAQEALELAAQPGGVVVGNEEAEADPSSNTMVGQGVLLENRFFMELF